MESRFRALIKVPITQRSSQFELSYKVQRAPDGTKKEEECYFFQNRKMGPQFKCVLSDTRVLVLAVAEKNVMADL